MNEWRGGWDRFLAWSVLLSWRYYAAVAGVGIGVVFAPFFEARVHAASFIRERPFPEGISPSGASWVDYDDDGDMDVTFPRFYPPDGTRNDVWENDGAGGFSLAGPAEPFTNGQAPLWADYDGDGDLDMAAAFSDFNGGGRGLRVWRNDDGAFSWMAANVVTPSGPRAAWGDFDNDGDLDLFWAETFSGPFLRILRNDRISFKEIQTPIRVEGLYHLADFDSDGDLDVVADFQGALKLWMNDRGQFAESAAALPRLTPGRILSGDFDNDGDDDLLLSLYERPDGPFIWRIRHLRNDLAGWHDVGDLSHGFGGVEASWVADFDNDGDLDILTRIYNTNPQRPGVGVFYNTGGGFNQSPEVAFDPDTITLIGAEILGDYNSDGAIDFLYSRFQDNTLVPEILRNTAPPNNPSTAPGGLAANVQGSTVTLSWTRPVGGPASGNGFTYNIRVGTAPGRGDVVSPSANLITGFVRLPAPGNAGSRAMARLRLAAGEYHWSVQAVNGAYVGGPFSAEGTFVVAEPEPAARTEEPIHRGAGVVLLRGETDPRGLLTEAWFEWGSTTAYGNSTPVQIFHGNRYQSLEAELTGLSIEAEYHYRLVARSAGGLSAGDDQRFHPHRFTPGQALGGANGLVRSQAVGDYDGDGDLDLALGVFTPGGPGDEARIWRNDPDEFRDISAGLPAIFSTAARDWGDYDGDGDLDLLIGGYDPNIWRNDEGVFTRINAGLPVNDGWSASFGDYDNDGDLDVLMAGHPVGGGSSFQIWRNDGGLFVDARANLPIYSNPSAVWGDYDNDGDLDVLISGDQGVASLTRICRNTHGHFEVLDLGLPRRGFGAVTWADYDGDGDLDFASQGAMPSGRPAVIWRNDGGFFSPVEATNLDAGRTVEVLQWLDYDNDGDPDLLVEEWITFRPIEVKVRLNNQGTFDWGESGAVDLSYLGSDAVISWADIDSDGDLDLVRNGQVWRNQGVERNAVPSAPSNLSAQAGPDRIALSWTASSDGQTHSSRLTYNLWVGGGIGGGDIAPPQSDLSGGYRRVPLPGNAGFGTSAFLSLLELPIGAYSFRVQAVDSVHGGGLFSDAISFEVAPGLPVAATGLAQAGSSTSATLYGRVNPMGSATEAWFEHGPTPSLGQRSASLHIVPGNTASIVRSISGLIPGAFYYYRVAAQNADGLGYGEIQRVRAPGFTALAGRHGGEEGRVAWGDYDGDGDMDFALGEEGVSILRNHVNTFSSITVPTPAPRYGGSAWNDFDGDGDLDLLVYGSQSPAALWRNNDGQFADLQLGLPVAGFGQRTADWLDFDNDGDSDLAIWPDFGDLEVWVNHRGNFLRTLLPRPVMDRVRILPADYDNDGDSDLLFAATSTHSGHRALALWQNQNGTFMPSGATLPDLIQASAAWGDFDADGDQDLLVCGAVPRAHLEWRTIVLRNENGVFVDIGASFPATADVAWADINGDGLLDICLHESSFAIFLNLGNNSFAEMPTDITGRGRAGFCDIDSDGDLDFFWGGTVWRNDFAMPNQRPGPPADLASIIMNGRVQFSWRSAADAETPAPGLTYNLRVGTGPGMGNVVASNSDAASGFRRIVSKGNAESGTTAFLSASGLPPGVYYWSAQAIDSIFAGGEWGGEQMFTIADSDGDALPNWWEDRHGLNSSVADADEDFDGDGQSNLYEFRAGTDPRDSGSALRILGVEPAGNDFLVTFAGADGYWYRLERSAESPSGPWTTARASIQGSVSSQTITDLGAAAQPQVFYRLVVE